VTVAQQFLEHLPTSLQLAGQPQGPRVLQHDGGPLREQLARLGQDAQGRPKPAHRCSRRPVDHGFTGVEQDRGRVLVNALHGSFYVVSEKRQRAVMAAEVLRGTRVGPRSPGGAGQVVGRGPHQRVVELEPWSIHVTESRVAELVQRVRRAVLR
jgi:hypothetical protein